MEAVGSRLVDLFHASGVAECKHVPTHDTLQQVPYGTRFFDMGLVYDFEGETWYGTMRNESRSQLLQGSLIETNILRVILPSRQVPNVRPRSIELQPLHDFVAQWFGDRELLPSVDIELNELQQNVSLRYYQEPTLEFIIQFETDLPAPPHYGSLFE